MAGSGSAQHIPRPPACPSAQSAVRTRVIDDASDDFADAASPWLSPAERAVKAAAAAQRERDAARRVRSVQLTIDLSGGGGAGAAGGVAVRESTKEEAASRAAEAAAAAAAAEAQAAAEAASAHALVGMSFPGPPLRASATAAPSATAPTTVGPAPLPPEPLLPLLDPHLPPWAALFGSSRIQHDDPLGLRAAAQAPLEAR